MKPKVYLDENKVYKVGKGKGKMVIEIKRDRIDEYYGGKLKKKCEFAIPCDIAKLLLNIK